MYIAEIVLFVLGLLGIVLCGIYWLWLFPLIDDKKRKQITGGKLGSPHEPQYKKYRRRIKWRVHIVVAISVVLSVLGLFFWL